MTGMHDGCRYVAVSLQNLRSFRTMDDRQSYFERSMQAIHALHMNANKKTLMQTFVKQCKLLCSADRAVVYLVDWETNRSTCCACLMCCTCCISTIGMLPHCPCARTVWGGHGQVEAAHCTSRYFGLHAWCTGSRW